VNRANWFTSRQAPGADTARSDDRASPPISKTVARQYRRFVRLAPRPLTSAALAGIGSLHIAWGLGSSFPFRTRTELADAVIGSDAVPSAAACHAVAVALFVASGLVADVPIGPRLLRRVGRTVVAGVLAVRGVAGLMGRADLLSPGSVSTRFRTLDRRFYSPLCLILAVGAASAPRG
jgi:hypothetical protein